MWPHNVYYVVQNKGVMVHEFVRSSCCVHFVLLSHFGMLGSPKNACCHRPFLRFVRCACCVHSNCHFRRGHCAILLRTPTRHHFSIGNCLCKPHCQTFRFGVHIRNVHFGHLGNLLHCFFHHFGCANCQSHLQNCQSHQEKASAPKTPSKTNFRTKVGSLKNTLQTHPILAVVQVE